MFKSIVAAVDGSSPSNNALDRAISCAQSSDTVLHLIHVLMTGASTRELMAIAEDKGFANAISDDLEAASIPPVSPADATMVPVEIIPHQVLAEFGDQLLKVMAEKAKAGGAAQVHSHSKSGDPAGAIIDCAADVGADLVVTGHRGHGQIKNLFLGSVAQKLVAEAKCPVLIVK